MYSSSVLRYTWKNGKVSLQSGNAGGNANVAALEQSEANVASPTPHRRQPSAGASLSTSQAWRQPNRSEPTHNTPTATTTATATTTSRPSSNYSAPRSALYSSGDPYAAMQRRNAGKRTVSFAPTLVQTEGEGTTDDDAQGSDGEAKPRKKKRSWFGNMFSWLSKDKGKGEKQEAQSHSKEPTPPPDGDSGSSTSHVEMKRLSPLSRADEDSGGESVVSPGAVSRELLASWEAASKELRQQRLQHGGSLHDLHSTDRPRALLREQSSPHLGRSKTPKHNTHTLHNFHNPHNRHPTSSSGGAPADLAVTARPSASPRIVSPLAPPVDAVADPNFEPVVLDDEESEGFFQAQAERGTALGDSNLHSVERMRRRSWLSQKRASGGSGADGGGKMVKAVRGSSGTESGGVHIRHTSGEESNSAFTFDVSEYPAGTPRGPSHGEDAWFSPDRRTNTEGSREEDSDGGGFMAQVNAAMMQLTDQDIQDAQAGEDGASDTHHTDAEGFTTLHVDTGVDMHDEDEDEKLAAIAGPAPSDSEGTNDELRTRREYVAMLRKARRSSIVVGLTKPRQFYHRNWMHYRQRLSTMADLEKVVKCPVYEDREEWMALKLIGMHRQCFQVYSLCASKCTTQSCPRTMAYGYEFRLSSSQLAVASSRADLPSGAFGSSRRSCTVPMPLYVEICGILNEKALADEGLFPHRLGTPFPDNFDQECGRICKRMFRIYAHIFSRHFPRYEVLKADKHLLTAFKYFMCFVYEFDLIPERELHILKDVLHALFYERDQRLAAEAEAKQLREEKMLMRQVAIAEQRKRLQEAATPARRTLRQRVRSLFGSSTALPTASELGTPGTSTAGADAGPSSFSQALWTGLMPGTPEEEPYADDNGGLASDSDGNSPYTGILRESARTPGTARAELMVTPGTTVHWKSRSPGTDDSSRSEELQLRRAPSNAGGVVGDYADSKDPTGDNGSSGWQNSGWTQVSNTVGEFQDFVGMPLPAAAASEAGSEHSSGPFGVSRQPSERENDGGLLHPRG